MANGYTSCKRLTLTSQAYTCVARFAIIVLKRVVYSVIYIIIKFNLHLPNKITFNTSPRAHLLDLIKLLFNTFPRAHFAHSLRMAACNGSGEWSGEHRVRINCVVYSTELFRTLWWGAQIAHLMRDAHFSLEHAHFAFRTLSDTVQ